MRNFSGSGDIGYCGSWYDERGLSVRRQIQHDLADAIRTSEANRMELTPSVARVLDPESVLSLETLMLTGRA